ncbi:MAG: aminoacyl-tRNA hydrolase [Chitinophagales bacterium]|nr:aminoacyl-tRNA hydrolase [Chitinophagales bacterium]MDW8427476.1 aminoacyl-tRNA hydrolase [Chitinophagales bacterium]
MTFLIAGLGNIGAQYENSRHNIGFRVADAWASRHRATFTADTLAFRAQFDFAGHQVHVIKPTTYMNESGRAVRHWQVQLKIPLSQLLVVVDDLALPFGTIRIRPKGSDGLHNGLTSVEQQLGTSAYPRLRIGIGHEFAPGQQVNYVLGPWSPQQQQQLPQVLELCCDALDSFIVVGLNKTMSRFNRKPQPPTTETPAVPD